MPTPKPNPSPKPGKDKRPYKYKTETKVIPPKAVGGNILFGPSVIIPGKVLTVKRAMSTAELNAEKKKAPKGTSVWRDPSVGFDGLKPRKKKK